MVVYKDVYKVVFVYKVGSIQGCIQRGIKKGIRVVLKCT